jgi:hypothetical protein
MKVKHSKFQKIEAKQMSSLVIVKKKKDDKKRSFVFVWIEAKKKVCICSSNIEDLPLLVLKLYSQNQHVFMHKDSCVKNILNSIIQFKCKELQEIMQAFPQI